MILFMCLSILETTGYMSRIAFFLDRVFHKFGLSGKSLIPFIVGSGCSVPGIMASRTVEDEDEKKMTITLKDECLVIENNGILQTIYYKDVTHISFYLGNLFVARAKPVTLSLYCKENKVSFEVTNPSLIMTQLIKKKCPTAKINHEGLKRGLEFLAISTIAAIAILILEYFDIPWMD
jgi:hypothetical protein